MVRQCAAMVRAGEIGKVRLVVTNFSHGHHGDATDADNPRVRWRYDPAMAGVSGQFADCGIHALHMASFVCDDEVENCRPISRQPFQPRAGRRRDGQLPHGWRHGGRLWTSSVAIGRQHGFDIQVFGETGGLRWASEQPNQLIYTPVGGRTQIIEKGEGGLHEDAQRLSRVSIAHPEGFPLAVANIYCDLADAIRGEVRDGLPGAAAGVAIHGGGSHGGGISETGRCVDGCAPTDVPRLSGSGRSVPRSTIWQGNSRASG